MPCWQNYVTWPLLLYFPLKDENESNDSLSYISLCPLIDPAPGPYPPARPRPPTPPSSCQVWLNQPSNGTLINLKLLCFMSKNIGKIKNIIGKKDLSQGTSENSVIVLRLPGHFVYMYLNTLYIYYSLFIALFVWCCFFFYHGRSEEEPRGLNAVTATFLLLQKSRSDRWSRNGWLST